MALRLVVRRSTLQSRMHFAVHPKGLVHPTPDLALERRNLRLGYTVRHPLKPCVPHADNPGGDCATVCAELALYNPEYFIVTLETLLPLCKADNPGGDYATVRAELALYNPEYCARPHLVALNKMDLPDAAQLASEVAQDVRDAAARMQAGFFLLSPCPPAPNE